MKAAIAVLVLVTVATQVVRAAPARQGQKAAAQTCRDAKPPQRCDASRVPTLILGIAY